MKTRLDYLLFMIVLMCGCATTTNVSNQNIAHIYKSSSSILHPTYTVYHTNETTSTVYFKVDASELLYIKKDDNTTTGRMSFTYTLKESFDSKVVLDTGSVTVLDINSNITNKWIIGKFTIKADYGKTYMVEVLLRDLNRIQSIKTTYLNVDKLTKNGSQNFLTINSKTNTPLFRNYIGIEDSAKIQYTAKETRQLWVSYFKRDFPLPPPPFSLREFEPFVYQPDSIFTLALTDSLFTVNFDKKGFYHVQVDTSNKSGFTVFRFDSDFPYIKKPEHLLEPLRYLTSKSEFSTMSNYRNIKLAVDSFWIHCGGSQMKGKELIRKFYGRMQSANMYFTSYLEGWRSDRGIIYLIYGPPQYLFKTNNLETWSYDNGGSRGQNGLSYLFSFTFVKVLNPFTDNDFRLERNPNYKDNWYSAVDSWRLGQIHSDN